MAGDSEDNGSDEDIFEALTDFLIGKALERGLERSRKNFANCFLEKQGSHYHHGDQQPDSQSLVSGKNH